MRNNAVLEGDVSLDRDDLIEWDKGKKNHVLYKEEDGSIILHVLDYFSCLLRLFLPLVV